MMISSADMVKLIGEIDKSYQNETDNNKSLLWAKMAVVEASGWTEDSIDEMLKAYIDSVNPICKENLLKKIEKTYGFHYASDFRNICVQILGNIMYEKIENKIPLECQQLQSALNGLKNSRDKSVHTHILNMGAIDAPHLSLAYVKKIENGLKKIMIELQNI